MRKNHLSILFVLGLSLILRADSCTETKNVDLVFGADFVATIQSSEGWTQANDENTVSVAMDQDLLEALNDVDIEGTVTSILVNGASFEMLTNDGHDARRNGSVYIRINNGSKTELLQWNSPNNQPGTKGYASSAPIDPATPSIRFEAVGLKSLNAALYEFLDNYNHGISPNTLTVDVIAEWDSTPPPTEQDPDNFSWQAKLLVQMKQDAVVDVPNF
jgi:hypothetical protein